MYGCHQYLKDTIWKQFTTWWRWWDFHRLVSPIPQRYNLKAIHNSGKKFEIPLYGVTNTSKIQSEINSQLSETLCLLSQRCHQYLKDTIWKQFTTVFFLFIYIWLVSPIPQRYNLKAIHNPNAIRELTLQGVTNTSKIQSESNSQRWRESEKPPVWCHQYLKDTIWKQFTTVGCVLSPHQSVSPIPQRYNLKAIHNIIFTGDCESKGVTNTSKIQSESNSQHMQLWELCNPGVTNTSKIQSESNSQHSLLTLCSFSRCHQYLKDTIWKQFTTCNFTIIEHRKVSPIPQRYNLKAIHNCAFFFCHCLNGVTNTSKIQSESNSQLKYL